MPTDLSLPVRKAIVAHLRAATGVTNLVPSARIFPEFRHDQADGTWPFIRMGHADATPFEATGWNGSEQDFDVHVFARGPGTDDVLTISAAVIEAMKSFAPGSIDGAWADWLRTIVLPDEKPEELHARVTFHVVAYEIEDI